MSPSISEGPPGVHPTQFLFPLFILYAYFHDVTGEIPGNGEGDVQRQALMELDYCLSLCNIL